MRIQGGERGISAGDLVGDGGGGGCKKRRRLRGSGGGHWGGCFFGEEGWGVEGVLVGKEGWRGFRGNGLEGGRVDGVVGLSDEWKYWKRLCLIASTDDLDHCKAVTGYLATLAR